MRPNKQRPTNPPAPVRRAIPASAPRLARTSSSYAAASSELSAFAADVQRFLADSKLCTILRGLRRDIDRADVPATCNA